LVEEPEEADELRVMIGKMEVGKSLSTLVLSRDL